MNRLALTWCKRYRAGFARGFADKPARSPDDRPSVRHTQSSPSRRAIRACRISWPKPDALSGTWTPPLVWPEGTKRQESVPVPQDAGTALGATWGNLGRHNRQAPQPAGPRCGLTDIANFDVCLLIFLIFLSCWHRNCTHLVSVSAHMQLDIRLGAAVM